MSLRALVCLCLAACTAITPEGEGGPSGATGTGATRGATGPTGADGQPGPAGSADTRSDILSKLGMMPFDKSVAIPIQSGMLQSGAALEYNGEYPLVNLSAPNEAVLTLFPVPQDALPDSAAEIRFLVTRPETASGSDCSARVELGAVLAFRAGVAWNDRATIVGSDFMLATRSVVASQVSIGTVRPGDALSVSATRGANLLSSPCVNVSIVSAQLLYKSATP